jgi:hypothetical protein
MLELAPLGVVEGIEGVDRQVVERVDLEGRGRLHGVTPVPSTTPRGRAAP